MLHVILLHTNCTSMLAYDISHTGTGTNGSSAGSLSSAQGNTAAIRFRSPIQVVLLKAV